MPSIHNKNNLEDLCISGVTKEDEIVRITLKGKNHKIGRIYNVFTLLADNNINVDIIVQAFGEHVDKNISFTIKETDLDQTLGILNQNADELDIQEIQYKAEYSKISIVGIGIANNPRSCCKPI